MSFACAPRSLFCRRSLDRTRIASVNCENERERIMRAREMKWKFLLPFQHKFLHLNTHITFTRFGFFVIANKISTQFSLQGVR